MDALTELRGELDSLDAQPLEIVARRGEVVGRISARARAQALGLDPDIAQDMFAVLFRDSLTRQEQDRVAASERGPGQRARFAASILPSDR